MNPIPPAHRPTIIPAIIVGGFSIVSALLGLLYNAMSFAGVLLAAFDPLLKQHDLPFFYHAYYLMSGVCVVCDVILLVCGVDLVMSRLRCVRLVCLVFLFEVVYFFAVGSLWLEPTIGPSVGAATGVANGGQMIQFLLLLPLWGPLLLWWAATREQVPASRIE